MRKWTTALLIGMTAACQQPGDRNAGNAAANGTDTADNAANTATNMTDAPSDNAAANEAEPSRSILRPDVVEKDKPPEITAVDTVIHFGDSAMALDDAARTAIDAVADAPATKAGGSITLRGHSDSRGNDGDNKAASRIRAERVRDYLVKQGVARDHIDIIAMGEGRPIAPNVKNDGSDDPEGRARNRRVELHVAPPVVTVPPPVTPKAAD